MAVAPSATPSRGRGARAAEINATDKRWEREHAEYRSLVRQGIQPATVDRVDELAKRATSVREIEMGKLLTAEQQRAFEEVGA